MTFRLDYLSEFGALALRLLLAFLIFGVPSVCWRADAISFLFQSRFAASISKIIILVGNLLK